MTRTGTICMVIIIITSIAGMIFCSVTQSRITGAGRRGRRPLRDEKAAEELAGEPVLFRTAEMRFVSCKASRSRRLEDVEIYGERALRMERQELAYILADQLLASGGIAFREEEGVLRAEVKAVLPEVQG